jgi:hypothetical protein
VLIQQRVIPNPVLDRISYQGIGDVRVILYRGVPAMAMLRLPDLHIRTSPIAMAPNGKDAGRSDPEHPAKEPRDRAKAKNGIHYESR